MSSATAEIEFLTLEVVLALHEHQLERYGGSAGLRDQGLLESAELERIVKTKPAR